MHAPGELRTSNAGISARLVASKRELDAQYGKRLKPKMVDGTNWGLTGLHILSRIEAQVKSTIPDEAHLSDSDSA